MVFQFCRRVWARFIDTALDVAGYERHRAEVIAAPGFRRNGTGSTQKNARAEIEQMAAGLKSRSQSIARARL